VRHYEHLTITVSASYMISHLQCFYVMSVSYLINNPSIKLKETRMIVVPYFAVVCQTQMIFAYISQHWRFSLPFWWLSFLWGSKSATGKSVKSRWETRD